jgi:hypothetical protein
MNSQEFCYWLQGFFEMTDAKEITPEQVDMIKRHLSLVFVNVTRPSVEEKGKEKKGKKRGKKGDVASTAEIAEWLSKIDPLEKVITVTCSSEPGDEDDYRRAEQDGHETHWPTAAWRNQVFC